MKGSNLQSAHPALHCFTAVINIARLSEGKELPLFKHMRSTKTSYKFVNAWGKIISEDILLGKNMFAACIERLHL